MKAQIIAALLMAGLLVCSLGAAAVPGFPAGEGKAGPLKLLIQGQIGRMMTLRSELEVTQEQRDRIRQILESHRSEIVAVVKPLVKNRRALRDATLAENADDAKIRAAANDLGKSIGDAALVAAKLKGEVGKLWTPEQSQKIEEFRSQSDAAVDKFVEKIASQS
jgi:Spy/CpxP family protein refolding chaperone